jgi:Zn-dependent protease|nr:site-2 protease family protein [Kofleriaceae bacterium]
MWKTTRLGTIGGFPIDLRPSFLLLLGFVWFAFGGVIGVAITLLTFASVVLHELGHAVVARELGVRVATIELGFFGGAAQMEAMPRRPKHELAIAAAGPAVSLILGGVGLGLAALTHVGLFALVGWINLVLAGFNLIPALPMDGGRILRALLATRLDYARATDVSVVVAQATAVVFGVLGLFGAYQLLMLAPFLWMMASRERLLARMPDPGERGERRYDARVLRFYR